MTRVALVIAVGEPGRDLSQVALPDWLTAKCAERLRARRPAIHQDKFHLPPPSHLHSSSKTTLLVPPSSQADVLGAQEIALRGLRSLARRCLDFPGLGAPRAPRGRHQAGAAFIKSLRKSVWYFKAIC